MHMHLCFHSPRGAGVHLPPTAPRRAGACSRQPHLVEPGLLPSTAPRRTGLAPVNSRSVGRGLAPADHIGRKGVTSPQIKRGRSAFAPRPRLLLLESPFSENLQRGPPASVSPFPASCIPLLCAYRCFIHSTHSCVLRSGGHQSRGNSNHPSSLPAL